jgi:hypothetical protein
MVLLKRQIKTIYYFGAKKSHFPVNIQGIRDFIWRMPGISCILEPKWNPYICVSMALKMKVCFVSQTSAVPS